MSAVEPQTKKSGINIKMLIVVVIVLFAMMLTTICVTYFLMSSILEPGSEKPEKIQLTTYEVGEILTNLSDKGYIKVSIVCLLDNNKVEEEIRQKDYEIRDHIFSILRSKKFDEVKDSTGMEKLRAEIQTTMNNILSQGKILDVFFTSIIVN